MSDLLHIWSLYIVWGQIYDTVPVTSKITIAILLSVCDLFLLMLVLRIWCLLKSNDSLQLRCLFIYSHQLFTQHCIDTVRGIYSMVMHGSERVDWFIPSISLFLCLQLRGGATMPVLCPFASFWFLALYTLTSVSIFSILFPIHVLWYWQGEFV